MSVAGTSRDSHSNHHPANGRKRRLSPHSNSTPTQDKTQTKLKLFSEKRKKLCIDVPGVLPPSHDTMSSASATSTHSDTKNKLSFPKNNLAAKAAVNNHTRKPGQGKKLVIKNRKGIRYTAFTNGSFIPLRFSSTLPPSPSPSLPPHLPPSLPPVKPDLPENYERQTWDKLREAICAVHTETPISYSLEELYQAVENMCSHRLAAQVYENLRRECERHVRSLLPTFQRYFPHPPSQCGCMRNCLCTLDLTWMMSSSCCWSTSSGRTTVGKW